MGRRKKPFITELKIEKVAAEGKCLGYYEDRVVFVPGTAPGDIVDVQVTRNRKSFMEGKAMKFHTYSDLRVKPFCQHFEHCGGCKWQHLPYEEQLAFKQQQVLDAFQRIGKLEFPEMRPIMGSENTRYYRNKLEFTFSNSRWLTEAEIKSGEDLNRNALGFHVPGRFDRIVDIEECFLQPEPSNAIRNRVKAYAIEKGLEFYDVKAHTGFLRNLLIRQSNRDEWMVILQVAHESEEIANILDILKAEFPQITSLQYVINDKKNETFHDLEVVCYAGESFITEEMEGLQFRIGPKSFFQTNSDQALELYKVARDFAGLSGKEVVYDLYTGTGTIAQFIAKKAQKVVGIEYVPEAIEDAKKNAALNQLDNTEFFAGDMKDLLNEDFVKTHGQPDVIITDPPRAGMHEDVVNTIIKAAPIKIVYVSCNPATQARDLELLQPYYNIEAVQPVDMFPHTHHVENVALLTQKA